MSVLIPVLFPAPVPASVRVPVPIPVPTPFLVPVPVPVLVPVPVPVPAPVLVPVPVPVPTRSTIKGGRGCNNFVPVLGGDGTKTSPTGDIFDKPPGEMS